MYPSPFVVESFHLCLGGLGAGSGELLADLETGL
jgi:hypothetical protein